MSLIAPQMLTDSGVEVAQGIHDVIEDIIRFGRSLLDGKVPSFPPTTTIASPLSEEIIEASNC